MSIETLTIVGVGLIGGSLGLAAKQRRVAARVIGVGRQQRSLDQARAVGAIDEGVLDLAAGARPADLIVFCTPVDRIADQVLEAAPHCRPGTLLTDAGSTKAGLVQAIVSRLPGHVAFVGSHPLAGSEKRGPVYADADLFEGRLTIVTRTSRTDEPALARTRHFWESVGARVKIMAPEAHDQALARTSHLPHLAASALAGILPAADAELTATGFRDCTRIAAGDPELWTAIFLQNRAAVLAALETLERQLDRFRQALQTSDATALTELLAQAKKVRDALGT